MIAALVRLSVENRLLVFLLAALLAALGTRGYLGLSVDAVPDVTSVQVQVLTSAPGLSPYEVESLVTRPVERAMSGLPGAQEVRSLSRTAVSGVTIVFDEDVDLNHARQLVAQRLPAARDAIPEGAGRPQMGPLTTALGEVYHFTLSWPGHESVDLRTLFDWEIAYPLGTVPGVVEVNAWGGDVRQIEVLLNTDALVALGVTQDEVEEALFSAGRDIGGGALERGEEQILLRLDAQYRSVEDVALQVVATREQGVPVLVRDVATVREGVAPRVAAATADGAGATQYVMVQMIAGGNAHQVVTRVKERLEEIKQRLPEGVVLKPFYDRAHFVDRVLSTVWRSLFEGGLVVAFVLFLFLGDWRAGLVVASTIPLSMLGAFACMEAFGLSGNLMSLGAIDFGLVVDGAVVLVESALATMAARKWDIQVALVQDSKKHGRAVAFGVLIIGIVYVPVLLLTGVEGKMFRPMGLTVLFALGTALILTFTWVPALASLVLKKEQKKEPRVIGLFRRIHEPLLGFFLGRIWPAALLVVALIGVGFYAASGLGADFVPRLEEGDIVLQLTRPPSISVQESERGTTVIEQTLLKFEEIERVVSRTGSPDVATDLMGIEQSDIFVVTNHEIRWTDEKREDLVARMEAALSEAMPGADIGFTLPIEMRVHELLGGAKSDVGIKVFGQEQGALSHLARQVAQVAEGIPGASDVRVEASEGLSVISIHPDTQRMGRLGVGAGALSRGVEALRVGREVGLLAEGDRRFGIQMRYNHQPRAELDELARYNLVLSPHRLMPLGDVTHLAKEDAPAQLSREQGRRRIMVEANVRGRDLGSFVGELQEQLKTLSRPTGYYFEITGQYQHLMRAAERLALVVPTTLAFIFILLYLIFHRVAPALLILLNVPVAASGGLLALMLRDMTFSVSAAVGLIALFGVATMNGVVLLSAIAEREAEGDSLLEAVTLGARERLRPVLTTAVVASLGFLPMAIATGTGAEVQRPLATVVIGGLVTATLLTLLVIPALRLQLRARGGG